MKYGNFNAVRPKGCFRIEKFRLSGKKRVETAGSRGSMQKQLLMQGKGVLGQRGDHNAIDQLDSQQHHHR